ncbi:MAG: hypothetical protein ACP5Q5_05445 [Brevinematia bacterium]
MKNIFIIKKDVMYSVNTFIGLILNNIMIDTRSSDAQIYPDKKLKEISHRITGKDITKKKNVIILKKVLFLFILVL